MHDTKQAFTLIELLVVIAIIAILAAILFPVFLRVQENGRRTVCLSNMKQMALGVAMYVQDYDEVLIPWLNNTGLPRDSARSDRTTWIELMYPYVKHGQIIRSGTLAPGASVPPAGIFRCPSFDMTRMKNAIDRPDCEGAGFWESHMVLAPRQFFGHYGISFAATGGDCTHTNPHYSYPGSDPINSDTWMSLAQISRPAETAHITEGVTAMGSDSNNTIWDLFACEAAASHVEGGNHLFIDGHAKWVKVNSQLPVTQDAQGCWYVTNYSVDR